MNSLKYVFTSIFMNIKSFLNLDINFFATLIVSTVKQLLFIVAWMFFFNRYKIIAGWRFNEMLVMFGIVSVGIGIIEIFFYGIRHLPELVENNQLDIYLVQPKNIVLNIAVSKTDISALGDLTTGLILSLFSGYLLSSFSLVVIFFINSAIFIFSLYLFLGSWSFFLKNSNSFIKEVYQNTLLLATQPNSAYKGVIKLITLTILPVGYMSFFPVEYLLSKSIYYFIYSTLGTTLFLILSYGFFFIGLKKYESGSSFIDRR